MSGYIAAARSPPSPHPQIGSSSCLGPHVVHQQQSESAYIFGAVCPQCDAAIGLVLPFATSQTMALHLEAVSQAVLPGRHAVLVLDQTGSHTTPKLPQFPNLSLLSLPAGSPELNPAEQVWQQLRDRDLANRCHDSYEYIIDACCEAWNKFTQIPDAIRSLCTRNWANLASVHGMSWLGIGMSCQIPSP